MEPPLESEDGRGGGLIDSTWSRVSHALSWDRLWRFVVVAFIALAALAFVLTTRRTDFPDSVYHRPADGFALWDWIDLSGIRHPQPWVNTLLYALLGADPLRLLGQAVISAAAWLFLATETRNSTNRALGTVIGLMVLLLALTPAVVTWNSLILSESHSLSFGAATIGAAIRLVRKRDGGALALFLVLATLFVFTRPNTLPVIGVSMLAAVIWVIADRSHRRLAAGAAIGLLVIGAWAAWRAANANESVLEFQPLRGERPVTYREGIFYVGLAYRVLPNPDFRAWLEARGMPECPALPEVPAEDSSFDYDKQVQDAIAECATFQAWAAQWGLNAYLRYMATHPAWTLDLLTRDAASLLTPVAYTPTASPVPSALDSLLVADLEPSWVRFGSRASLTKYNWTWYEPLFLWTTFAVVLMVWRRRTIDWRVAGVAITLVAASVAYLVSTWLLIPLELERHGVPMNVLVRVAPLLLIGATVPRRGRANGDPDAANGQTSLSA